MDKAIGIDLGTTFSAVSYIDKFGRPVILKNSLGSSTTPSVIFFESENNQIVGEEAKEEQGFGEKNIASFFKRDMGDVNYQLSFYGKDYSATDLSTILLKHLKKEVEESINEKINQAVVTVPAYFNDLQKKATIKAAEDAGIEVLRIINEPTAAALSYGINQTKDQTVLVYDLGGGTFDVTILKIANSAIQVIATGGDHELGGKDWDNRIINYFANQFNEEFGFDILDDPVTFNDLLVKGEDAKRTLSLKETAKFSIISDGNRGSYTITRDKFEEITADLLQKTKMKVEEILEDAEMSWKDLDGVLLVGGSTRMPMVSKWVEKISGKPLLKGINVDEAVCLGAAIQAEAILQKKDKKNFSLGGKPFSIEDVMSHSLGLIAENNDRSRYINSIIIPKNIRVPALEERPYQIQTGRNRGNELEVYLTQGETDVIGECKIIGKYVFSDIDFIEGGLSVVDVEYQYDENGTVQISAKQRETNKILSMQEVPLPEDMSWVDREPVKEEFKSSHLSVVFAIDLSGSMSGDPLRKAKEAANGFIDNLDLTNTSVAFMPFANTVTINQNFTQNNKKLKNGVNNWTIGPLGFGNATHPFDEAFQILKDREDPRFIIVLADGVWGCQTQAIASAEKCAKNGIEIIAIGFGSADENFLQKIATAEENALFTDLGKLVSSFSKIAQVLTESGGNINPSRNSKIKRGFLGFK